MDSCTVFFSSAVLKLFSVRPLRDRFSVDKVQVGKLNNQEQRLPRGREEGLVRIFYVLVNSCTAVPGTYVYQIQSVPVDYDAGG